MNLRRFLLAFLVLGGAGLVLPDTLLAWTPGTHVFLGQSILHLATHLPAEVGGLIRSFPYDFLYGTIAPDTSFAKKYAPIDRHCHAWHVGQEVRETATSDALRAFGYGYLAHLAADTIAHNYFVPRQLMMTSSTRSFGHSYWESRAELPLGGDYARQATELIRMDHTPVHEHLDNIISPTLFSVKTNRRIFRGMVHLTRTQAWQRGMRAAKEVSRWGLTDDDVWKHLSLALDHTMEALTEADAEVLTIDPNGHEPLQRAKALRRAAMMSGGWRNPEQVSEYANREFGLPERSPVHWPAVAEHILNGNRQ